MPRGDGTGPRGMGARTGRAAGFCAGFEMPGYANPVQGWGYGMSCGRGRGWRNMFHATGLPGRARFAGYGVPYGPTDQPDQDMQKQLLKRQAEDLQAELALIKKRLAEVEKETVAE
ncbi:hypothetical protein Pcar_1582 [Syntrophotalea carbinolica DSM 2380]|uniref:DUF5320 domain-containing protein n=2 Tax=Syntrophotalea carbinolica TaxID=19 RepID=Q3A481_SYNC1|nr:DUF5320 domain-containing protein [Syntrophotalea carbinolica]ABA88826.1 hypothetical protein Pcar_1582 [Syntrophotalea carbinolica DSM 2380]